MKKGITKVPDFSSSSATQIKEYPYIKPQTIIQRYGNHNTITETPEQGQGRKSFS